MEELSPFSVPLGPDPHQCDVERGVAMMPFKKTLVIGAALALVLVFALGGGTVAQEAPSGELSVWGPPVDDNGT